MANETVLQASFTHENPEADESNENVPPGVDAAGGTSKLKVQTKDVMGISSMQLNEESGLLSDACTFSTPAPTSGNSGGKAKSRLSGFQSALTPILKYLNLKTKQTTPEPLKYGFSTANSQKSTEESGQNPNFSTTSRRSFTNTKSPVCLLDYECLPEMTLLDVSCDPTMQLTTNDSVLPENTPAVPKVCKAITCVEENNAGPSGFPKLVKTMMPTQATIKTDNPYENKTPATASKIHEQYFPEITLLDVSRESLLSPGGRISVLDITKDTSQALSEHSEQIVIETGRVNADSNAKLSDTSVQSVKYVKEDASKTSLEATQDIAMGSILKRSTSLSNTSGENNEKPQTPTEDTFDALPVNITRDITSCSDMSFQCAHASTSAMECNFSPKDPNLEKQSGPTQTPANAEATKEELLANKVSPQSLKTALSENNMVPVVQASRLSTSSSFNTTTPTSCRENKTLDLPTFNMNSPEVKRQDTDQTGSLPTETIFIVNQNFSASKESSQCEVQTATFDQHSLQKSSSSGVGEVVATTLQNNTFDCKPLSQQNGTITLSEMSSGDGQHNTLEKPPSPRPCNLTISLKNENSDIHPAELLKHNDARAATEPHTKMVENNITFEADPFLLSVSEGTCETKEHSKSGLPQTDGLSDPSSHHSTDAHHKANSFNLDETLDLRVDSLITSTPMTNCKIFNFNTEREAGKIQAAPKKLYGDGPSKPADEAPSNIICDRKTFLTHVAVKSFWPPSQLLEKKLGSTRQGRLEPVTSGLPVKRQKTQVDALRNTASAETRGTTGVSSSYSLRSAAAVSKLPSSGLQRPQVNGILSAIQKAAPGLRPPSARITAQASSNADKTSGPRPGATNLVNKMSRGKTHPLIKEEALPVAKRKKTDTFVAPYNVKALSSAHDTLNRAKNLKQPTTIQRSVPAETPKNDVAVPANTAETLPLLGTASRARALRQPVPSHRALMAKPQTLSCAKCSALEEQLKIKEEEIQRLKKELLKYRKQEDC